MIAAQFETNPESVPPEIYDVCTPSDGGREVVNATRTHCETHKWVALDLIGAFGFHTAVFSIDQLPMYVYAVDGEFIQPQLVHAVTVTNGDRYSVLVDLTDAQPGDYPMRLASVAPLQLLATHGILSYRVEKSEQPLLESTTPYILDNGRPASPATVFFSQAAQKQFHPPETLPAPGTYSVAQTFKLSMRVAGTSYEWALNHTSLPSEHTDAHATADPVVLFSPQPYRADNTTITTTNGTYVDLVFITAQAPQPAHPIHKHGNKMWLLGSGAGSFPWATVDEAAAANPAAFNLVDPPRRDGFATPPAPAGQGPRWMAVRYHASHPGAWLLHCHVQGHLTGGMAVVIQDGIDHWPEVPIEYLTYV